eukprot:CAMPEP_0172666634 /NCGR_PEP_ID=MMETSP1074-20121228/7922_1 /TAXON_ID=2916 /ORGANISM="Ceratium fusus, Strain PA161109" /LENGTH=271 /DNA_ID=CAMNT_0013483039 /DNA_START=27 /DNA_END=842 /DNA_ORIENTATION=+
MATVIPVSAKAAGKPCKTGKVLEVGVRRQVGGSPRRTVKRDNSWRIDASDKTDRRWPGVPDAAQPPGVALQPFWLSLKRVSNGDYLQREDAQKKRRERFTACCRPVEANQNLLRARERKAEDAGDIAKDKKASRRSANSGKIAFAEGQSRRALAARFAKASTPMQDDWERHRHSATILPLKATNPKISVWGRTVASPESPRGHEVDTTFGQHDERLSDRSLSTSNGPDAMSQTTASVVGSTCSQSTSSASPQLFDISLDDMDEEEASYFPA